MNSVEIKLPQEIGGKLRHQVGRQREEKLRAKTAPNARECRRNWDMNSVEIKTTSGDRRKVKAPGR